MDRINYLSESKSQLQVTIDKELLIKFEKLKSLMSHENLNPTYNELLHQALDAVIEKKEKAKGVFVKPMSESIEPKTHGFADKNSKGHSSRYISRSVKREVLKRSKGRCEFIYRNGLRCESDFQLQFDHIKAHSRGGDSDFSNIQSLCRVHNAWKGSSPPQ